VKGLCLISAPDRLPPDVQFWTGIIFVAGSLLFIAWIWFDATNFSSGWRGGKGTIVIQNYLRRTGSGSRIEPKQ
jgi:hypothetical protein